MFIGFFPLETYHSISHLFSISIFFPIFPVFFSHFVHVTLTLFSLYVPSAPEVQFCCYRGAPRPNPPHGTGLPFCTIWLTHTLMSLSIKSCFVNSHWEDPPTRFFWVEMQICPLKDFSLEEKLPVPGTFKAFTPKLNSLLNLC